MKLTPFAGAVAGALVLTHALPSHAQSTASFAHEKDPHASSSVDVGVLAGAGFPRPLAIEGVVGIDHLVLFGAEYSALPQVTISGVQTNLWAVAGDVRIFPTRGSFFIGLRAGRQHLGEQGSLTVASQTLTASQTADTTFVNPRIGFLWRWQALALGIDAGVQIPVNTSTSSTLPPGITPPSAVTTVTNTLSQSVIPTVDLLRIGVVL